MSQRELQEVVQLKTIDTKVRAHEMAHLAVAGSYARGGVSFQFAKGPDGKNYAVGGEVPIDVSKEATPQATINKMQVVKAAALAPADPSPQDRKVAAAATATIGEAEQQLRLEELAQAKDAGRKCQGGHSGRFDRSGFFLGGDCRNGPTTGAIGRGWEKVRNGLVGRYLGASRADRPRFCGGRLTGHEKRRGASGRRQRARGGFALLALET